MGCSHYRRRENELIAWTSVEGAAIETSGRVHFKPAPGNRGTEVKTVREFTRLGYRLGLAGVRAASRREARRRHR